MRTARPVTENAQAGTLQRKNCLANGCKSASENLFCVDRYFGIDAYVPTYDSRSLHLTKSLKHIFCVKITAHGSQTVELHWQNKPKLRVDHGAESREQRAAQRAKIREESRTEQRAKQSCDLHDRTLASKPQGSMREKQCGDQ